MAGLTIKPPGPQEALEQGSVSLVPSGSHRQTGQKVTPSPPKKVAHQPWLFGTAVLFPLCSHSRGPPKFIREEVGVGGVSLPLHPSLT